MSVQIANNNFPRLLGTCRPGHKVHIFVIDAVNAIFIAKTRDILNPGNNAFVQAGIKLLNASGPAEINWEGEVWYIGNAASVAFEGSIE